MRSALLGAFLGATALAPTVQAQSSHPAPVTAPQGQVRAKAAIAECDSLIAYLEQSRDVGNEVTLDLARSWRETLNPEPCRETLERLTSARETVVPASNPESGSQPAAAPAPESLGAAPRVESAQQIPQTQQGSEQPSAGATTPQVLVQQNQPNVTVRQKRPEIIVRQAPPIITVQQPQPEIIVRMPEPDVNVATVQPQVEVRMVEPRIQVVPPQTEVRPNIQVDQQKPDVRYERTGEPEIIYQPAEGEPKIRFEPAGPEVADQRRSAAPPAPASAEAQDGRSAAGSPEPSDRLSRQGAQARLNTTLAATDTAPPRGGPGQTGAIPGVVQQSLKVSDLEERTLFGANGEEIGPVSNVVSGPQDRQFFVVSYGGFLGLGAKEIAVPVDQVALRDDRLIAQELTNESLNDTPAFEGGRTYRDLDEGETTVVRVLR